MKKIFLLVISLLVLSGCTIFKDNLEGAKIYTTIYPIEFLVETIYGDYATIESIYPKDTDPYTYKLTDKQISEYAKSDLFVYNGLSNEKTIAKNLINKNNKLLIIDVSYGLNYTSALEELWLSPNNYLMLAKNIKDNLNEYLKNKTLIASINQKYNDFAEVISLMDADLRTIGKEAKEKGKNTIVVGDDVFNFLTNYGFNVISIDKDTVNEVTLNNVTKAFKNKEYKGIIINNNELDSEMDKTISEANATKINMTTMLNKTDEDYITIMQRFIDDVRNLVLAE